MIELYGEEDLLEREMRLIKTGEDAISFFAKHGNQTDLKFVYCMLKRSLFVYSL